MSIRKWSSVAEFADTARSNWRATRGDIPRKWMDVVESKMYKSTINRALILYKLRRDSLLLGGSPRCQQRVRNRRKRRNR
jgi:hypothetical protein